MAFQSPAGTLLLGSSSQQITYPTTLLKILHLSRLAVTVWPLSKSLTAQLQGCSVVQLPPGVPVTDNDMLYCYDFAFAYTVRDIGSCFHINQCSVLWYLGAM